MLKALIVCVITSVCVCVCMCVCVCVCFPEQDIGVVVYGLYQQDEGLYKQLSKGTLAILKYCKSQTTPIALSRCNRNTVFPHQNPSSNITHAKFSFQNQQNPPLNTSAVVDKDHCDHHQVF